jgi:hypothetical protein
MIITRISVRRWMQFGWEEIFTAVIKRMRWKWLLQLGHPPHCRAKFVLPYVSKFIALTNTYPKGSGEGEFASFVLLVCNAYLYYLTFFFFKTQIEKDTITESIYSFWNKTAVLILLMFTGHHGST